jgi:hypothetical protein
MKTHDLDTTGWLSYPFTYEGVEFVSLVSPQSPLLSRILSLPEGAFVTMNRGAIASLVGDTLTREYIVEKLTEINEHASHAVLELVG